MRKVVIMRGLPGCGKTTTARNLLANQKGIICSADDFFVNDKGVYVFDQRYLKQAHKACKVKFWNSLDNYDLIIVDNTNTQHWEYAWYQEAATVANYEIEIMPMAFRSIEEMTRDNKHGAPKDAIIRMKERWEA